MPTGTPQAGAWLDTAAAVEDEFARGSTGTSLAAQHLVLDNNGTPCLLVPFSNWRFMYYDGSSWNKCSTILTTYNGVDHGAMLIYNPGSDTFYFVGSDFGLTGTIRLIAFTFSGTDITVLKESTHTIGGGSGITEVPHTGWVTWVDPADSDNDMIAFFAGEGGNTDYVCQFKYDHSAASFTDIDEDAGANTGGFESGAGGGIWIDDGNESSPNFPYISDFSTWNANDSVLIQFFEDWQSSSPSVNAVAFDLSKDTGTSPDTLVMGSYTNGAAEEVNATPHNTGLITGWHSGGTNYVFMYCIDDGEFEIASRASFADTTTNWTNTAEGNPTSWPTGEPNACGLQYNPITGKVLCVWLDVSTTASLYYAYWDQATGAWGSTTTVFSGATVASTPTNEEDVSYFIGLPAYFDPSETFYWEGIMWVEGDATDGYYAILELDSSLGVFITDTALTDSDTLNTDSIKRLLSDPSLTDGDTLTTDSFTRSGVTDPALVDADTLNVDTLLLGIFVSDPALVDADTLNVDTLERSGLTDPALVDTDTLYVDTINRITGTLTRWWIWRFVRMSGNLYLVPKKNYAAWKADAEIVSGDIRFLSSLHDFAMETVASAWAANKNESQATLTAAINSALDTANFVAADGGSLV